MQSKRHRNQYTIRTEAEERKASYDWLLSSLQQPKSLYNSMYTCWIPSGQGISKTVSGYLRFSHIGKKVFCHVFTWNYHHNGCRDHRYIAIEGDISPHLCRNKQCCRPSHLTKEDRSANKSRDNCPGIVSCTLHKEEAFQLCKHWPRCLYISTFTCIHDKVSLNK